MSDDNIQGELPKTVLSQAVRNMLPGSGLAAMTPSEKDLECVIRALTYVFYEMRKSIENNPTSQLIKARDCVTTHLINFLKEVSLKATYFIVSHEGAAVIKTQISTIGGIYSYAKQLADKTESNSDFVWSYVCYRDHAPRSQNEPGLRVARITLPELISDAYSEFATTLAEYNCCPELVAVREEFEAATAVVKNYPTAALKQHMQTTKTHLALLEGNSAAEIKAVALAHQHRMRLALEELYLLK